MCFQYSVADDGKVIKALNSASFDSDKTVNSVVIEELQVLPPSVAVKNLYVVHMDGEDSKLVVVSDDEIQAVKLQRCNSDKITNCRYVISNKTIGIYCSQIDMYLLYTNLCTIESTHLLHTVGWRMLYFFKPYNFLFAYAVGTVHFEIFLRLC